MSELTESLRHMADDSMGMEPGDRQVFSEAANRIEALKAEPARLQEILLRQTKLNTKIINEKIALQTQLKAVRECGTYTVTGDMELVVVENGIYMLTDEVRRTAAQEAGE
jgi:hypothetical protein